MKKTTQRVLSLLASIALTAAVIPSAVAEDVSVDSDKLHRTAYVHAQQTSAPTGTSAVEEFMLGDRTDVYFALDSANKGGIDEPQYNLNAYLIKFYYNPAFFDLLDRNGNVITDLSKVTSPIDYTVAFDGQGGDGSVDTDENLGADMPNTHDGVFQIFDQGLTTNARTENGITYNAAYLTCLLRGVSYPDKPDEQEWQNICKLPLKPKTTGTSQVFIELMDTTDEGHGLRLLPKHVKGYPQEFTLSYVNNCSVTINVIQRTRPMPPVPDPMPGRYTTTQYVHLTSNETGDSVKIYYSTNPNAPLTVGDKNYLEYTGTTGIPVTTDTKIKCYVERTVGGVTAYSDVVEYEYFIVPEKPTLYLKDDTSYNPSPNFYASKEPFDVYLSDQNPYAPIDAANEVYYTFSNAPVEDITKDGTDDPYTGWVKVKKNDPKFNVSGTLNVKAVTALIDGQGNIDKLSDTAFYEFRIVPQNVIVDPEPSTPQSRVDVTLSCPTEGANIYYTLDGSDPRSGGILYDGTPLDVAYDTVLKVVAEKDGAYSDVGTYEYDFDYENAAVHAFVPPGSYENSADVVLYSDDYDDTIYYTTDGTDPTESSNVFKKGDTLHLTEDTTIKAYVKKADGTFSEVTEFVYKIRPSAPKIAPSSREFADSGIVYVSAPSDSDADVYYTTDGTDPRTSDTRIKLEGGSAAFPITEDTTVKAVSVKGSAYSEVVTETYTVAHSVVLAKPAVTMPEGIYIAPNAVESNFTTAFEAPDKDDVTIYYTIGTTADNSYIQPDPNLTDTTGATKKYTPGEQIPLKGETLIKAIAVDAEGHKSDMGIYHYTVIPEAPILPKHVNVSAPMLPVTAIPNSIVTYTLSINGQSVTNTVSITDATFYIDASTGKAYSDAAKTTELPTENSFTAALNAGDILSLTARTTLDGVTGEASASRIPISAETVPVPPTADRASGVYDEAVMDGATDNTLMEVTLTAEADAVIQYRVSGTDEWLTYDKPIRIYGDTTIYTRSVKGGVTGNAAVYVYQFIPLAPIITPASQTFTGEISARITLDPRAPKGKDYAIYYRRSGDNAYVIYSTNPYTDNPTITVNMSQMISAYVVRDDMTRARKMSGTTAAVYTLGTQLEIPELNLPHIDEFGKVVYYTEGQELVFKDKYPDRSDIILYYTTDGSDPLTSETRKAYIPGEKITLTEEMTEIRAVYAMKCGVCESEESGGDCTRLSYGKVGVYTYYIKKGGIVPTSAPSAEPTAAPSVSPSPTRKPGGGGGGGGGGFSPRATATPKPAETPSEAPIATTAPSETTAPAATTAPDNTTTDMFGRTYNTHEQYIFGYPEGDVKPDGHITREEMAAIVYRVMPDSYRTGGAAAFPDTTGRWSEKMISELADIGIITGYPDGSFKPDSSITRAEAAVMIMKLLKLDSGEGKAFTDISGHWGAPYIGAVSNAGVIAGYPDGTFRPDSSITRAETVTIFNKILGRKPDIAYLRTRDINPFYDLDPSAWHYGEMLEAAVSHDYELNADGSETDWTIGGER